MGERRTLGKPITRPDAASCRPADRERRRYPPAETSRPGAPMKGKRRREAARATAPSRRPTGSKAADDHSKGRRSSARRRRRPRGRAPTEGTEGGRSACTGQARLERGRDKQNPEAPPPKLPSILKVAKATLSPEGGWGALEGALPAQDKRGETAGAPGRAGGYEGTKAENAQGKGPSTTDSHESKRGEAKSQAPPG